ncbi:periplasmic heavy metal sensor [Geminisphaera colitermitum]|uniref:periplasmic heavy metal sensor n=1 Tax=Geminisphaera colitermitum TaxID=1148786 RepID=UPI0001964F83|nr:periplasmic heavy metal sensor [Geminisphaera colitermitum]
MKRLLYTALAALAACALAFGLTHWLGCVPHATAGNDTLAWLQKEFALTPAQTDAIQKLHAAYEPICEEHCRRIQETRTRLAAASAAPDASAHAAAQSDLDHLTRLCRDTTLAHLRQVASQMTPEQGRRFLALTEPKLETAPHDQPMGLK